jgi:hypothetical protein
MISEGDTQSGEDAKDQKHDHLEEVDTILIKVPRNNGDG